MAEQKTELKIEFEYVGSLPDKTEDAEAIRSITIACDEDFIPWLSVRDSSTAVLTEQILHDRDIKPYVDQVLAQKNIVARYDGKVVAYMSFIHDFAKHYFFPDIVKPGNEKLDIPKDKINYISTICVLPEYRRNHIAKRFYDYIENSLPAEVRAECVATRTWSTNGSHIELLIKRGYSLTCTLYNDRVTKEGAKLNTVYYCMRIADAASKTEGGK